MNPLPSDILTSVLRVRRHRCLKKKTTTIQGTHFLPYKAVVLVLLSTTAKSADGKDTSVVLEPLPPDTTEKSAPGDEDAVGMGEDADP